MRFFTVYSTQQIDNQTNLLFTNFHLVILALITCFCICANLITFFLLIFCRPLQRSSRTTNLFIISLCLADLGVGCVVMPLMLLHEWKINFPYWLCQFWQLVDLIFSTESLYSICAIALDRVWNLEKPLRSKTFNANYLILPLLILPVYLFSCLTRKTANVGMQHSSDFHCFPSPEVSKQVLWVALPTLYLPAIFLHSSLPNLEPIPSLIQQPVQQQSLLSPIQINTFENKIERVEKVKPNEKRASVCETSKNNNKTLRKVSLPQCCRKPTISGLPKINEIEKFKTKIELINNEQPTSPSFFISEEEEEENNFNLNKPPIKQRQQRLSSARFSIITFSENISLLLRKESVTQQIKAAKAVALILCCFLLCWFPFLLVWPLLFRLCLWLNYLCSSINPLLYTLSTPKIRSLFKSKKYSKFIFVNAEKNKKRNEEFI
ncbi:G_PROTEIN_RECEP_F1_2 domain-containing protein [Meloidogyne graminicola]|uniref:G_PROTEIN_RECEP_F1_2 domain-containing protein n=1 Tax=Meloidogyne graminicola TaxID=189291 RepID=A0A8S9ZG59_9BILA|nr:G_PROTEIN_RECEP_F1_2 domain-containing protein [Meloidogyne graminicola]